MAKAALDIHPLLLSSLVFLQDFVFAAFTLIPPKRFDMFPPMTGGCSEGLGVLWFFFKLYLIGSIINSIISTT